MRHKFVPLPQPLSNGAVACCESCGALNNAGVLGCIADEAPAQGNYPVPVNFIEQFPSHILHICILFAFDECHLMI